MGTMHQHESELQRRNARREANRWLTRRLTWEDRLSELHADAPRPETTTAAGRRPAA